MGFYRAYSRALRKGFFLALVFLGGIIILIGSPIIIPPL
jgi:hypothetical protein